MPSEHIRLEVPAMPYIDGFVLVVPKKNVKRYVATAKRASRIFKEFGALEFRECQGDDLNMGMGVPFPKLLKTKPTETVFFSFITYKSRAQRDRVNAKIMKDPRMAAMCGPDNTPFDIGRMSCGGFEVVVSA
jgi:uncharacterized protein YbaA (DUF1428 family)